MRALNVPLRLDAIASTLLTRPELGGYVGEPNLGNLGRDLGRELAAGGLTPLSDALASNLVEERSGDSRLPADGVVVIREAEPQAGPTSKFLAGLYDGIRQHGRSGRRGRAGSGGAERDSRVPAARPLDGGRGRQRTGRLALVLLLADAEPGDYGVRDTAEDGILPPIEPLPPTR